jgi:putative ABC transport system ATP-binding protein
MVRLEKVVKTYQTHRGVCKALDEVTLSIEKGQFVVICGPSGSGKTTLLMTIAAMLHPSSGTVTIEGHNLYAQTARARAIFRAQNIGFVFQDFALVPYLNVAENVALAGGTQLRRERLAPRVRGDKLAPAKAGAGTATDPAIAALQSTSRLAQGPAASKPQVLAMANHPQAAIEDATQRGPNCGAKRAYELIEKLGLTDRIYHKPSQLSAGEKQRTAIARALLNRPKIILADEPTGNLDPDNAAAVLGYLADFHRQGGTVILATHGPAAKEFADRIIYLRNGRVDSCKV